MNITIKGDLVELENNGALLVLPLADYPAPFREFVFQEKEHDILTRKPLIEPKVGPYASYRLNGYCESCEG